MKPRVDEHLRCTETRASIQARLDEPLPADRETALRRHLRECQACLAYQTELGAMRDALRSMPLFRLPAEVREDVQSALAARDIGQDWILRRFAGLRRRLAIAAALMLAVGGSWWTLRSPDPHFSEMEVAQAAEDLEFALALAAGALGEVERIAQQDVLAEQLLPAMRQLFVRWPIAAKTPFEDGGSGDDQ